MYKTQRNYENVEKQCYLGVGKYNIPQIQPCEYDGVKDWVPYNYANTTKDCADKGIHFFLDDYQFMRLWRNPDAYIPLFYKYKYILSPDFSTYTDFPMALQIYNHYRKHWLARYYQEHMINVIPTISWSTEDSFEWCFTGEPIHSTVAISSQSCLTTSAKKELFLAGYNEMMQRLEPKCIIFYGEIPEECTLPDKVVRVDSFSKRRWN